MAKLAIITKLWISIITDFQSRLVRSIATYIRTGCNTASNNVQTDCIKLSQTLKK